jgi:hypothetical protein
MEQVGKVGAGFTLIGCDRLKIAKPALGVNVSSIRPNGITATKTEKIPAFKLKAKKKRKKKESFSFFLFPFYFLVFTSLAKPPKNSAMS